jgi:CHAT domain-containing protein
LSFHARTALREAAEHLDRRLVGPLREVGDRPLVVVPSTVVYSLPWCVLPSCVGRPVTVSPSAKLWRRAADRPVPVRARTVVVGGPGLPGAEAEASAIAALHPGASLLSGSDATASAVAEAAADAAMLHVAAHGTLRADNALFSSLLLADGPFTVYEMERVAFAPHHVVLAGCDTGRMQHVAGEEILGFAAAMLGGGTSTLVASVVPVPDRATLPVMMAYHEALLTGLSPAAALAGVQERIDRDDVSGTAAAAGFTCLGAG